MSDATDPEPPLDPAAVSDMPLARVACPRHGEPFRAKWPAGYLPFALFGIQYLLEQDAHFRQDLKKLADAGVESLRAIERLLDERPVCCRLPSRVLLENYLKAGALVKDDPVFRESKCFNCRKVAPGGPYRVAHAGGTVQHVPHVCLRCVVYFMEPSS